MSILDALRGFAAIGVAMVHFTSSMGETWFKAICHYGWLGVDVFFVISGFVIPYALANCGYQFPSDFPRFMAKRIVRLHPPYLATVILMMAFWCLPSDGNIYSTLGVFGTHAAFLNGIMGIPWLSNVFWSLAIEMQFYLFIGMTYFLLVGTPMKKWMALASFLLIAMLPFPQVWLPPHLPLFTFGILAYLKAENKISPWTLYMGVAVTGAVCAHVMGKPQALVGAATAMSICHIRWDIPKWLAGLGAVSYSLYLLHPLVGEYSVEHFSRWVWAKRICSVTDQMIAAGCALVLSLAGAWVWYRLIELPFQRLSTSITYRRGLSVDTAPIRPSAML